MPHSKGMPSNPPTALPSPPAPPPVQCTSLKSEKSAPDLHRATCSETRRWPKRPLALIAAEELYAIQKRGLPSELQCPETVRKVTACGQRDQPEAQAPRSVEAQPAQGRRACVRYAHARCRAPGRRTSRVSPAEPMRAGGRQGGVESGGRASTLRRTSSVSAVRPHAAA